MIANCAVFIEGELICFQTVTRVRINIQVSISEKLWIEGGVTIKQFLKLPLIIILFSLLLSCSTRPTLVYKGPGLPGWQVALLYTDRLLYLKEIDGFTRTQIRDEFNPELIGGLKGLWYGVGPDPFELLPGEHIIKVRGTSDLGISQYSHSSISGSWVLKIVVEAGHKYLLTYKTGQSIETGRDLVYKSRITSVYVHDKETKEVVSEYVKDKK